MTEPLVIVVAGATATGKTDAALALARHLDGELIGADSVQLYRGFDIGSAKPTPGELGGVAHHLIDIADPDEDIDAMKYAALADAAIGQVRGRGRVPIVVGGTGLYLRALIRGLVDVPKVDPVLRARLEAEAETLGPALHRRLMEVDPLSGARIHPNDRVRTVRALEVFEQTGQPLGELRAAHALGHPRHSHRFIVVERDREEHRSAVHERVRQMLEGGWIEEVAALRARWGDGVRALGSVGYKALVEHLRDEVSLVETERKIRKRTWVYARRQRTWWKNEPGVHLRAAAGQLGEMRLKDLEQLGV